MQSVLVTGGAGFIGSHVVDAYVRAGLRVLVIDDLSTGKRENLPAEAEFIEGDVRDAGLLARYLPMVDGCIHLAAIASVERSCEQWSLTHTVNLTGTLNVFEAAFQTKTPVVYASSAAVYGKPKTLPLDEDSPIRPISPYGADKAACELHAQAAWEVHGLPSRGMRFFNVYGPRQDPHSPYSGVISIFAQRMLQGEPVTIFGDGEQTRDFIYVSDVVAALQAALADCSKFHRVYAVCRGQSVTIRQLAAQMAELTGYPREIQHAAARDGDIRESLGCPQRLQQELKITPQIELREGLTRTLDSLNVADVALSS